MSAETRSADGELEQEHDLQEFQGAVIFPARNLSEHQTFFSANEQRRRPGAASAEAFGLRGEER